MNDLDPFSYPTTAHERRHGPKGYKNFSSFKPWLRDEFVFRCVYCLNRERWYPDGSASFSVDHLYPKGEMPERENDYTNLVYSCHRCMLSRVYPDSRFESILIRLRRFEAPILSIFNIFINLQLCSYLIWEGEPPDEPLLSIPF